LGLNIVSENRWETVNQEGVKILAMLIAVSGGKEMGQPCTLRIFLEGNVVSAMTLFSR